MSFDVICQQGAVLGEYHAGRMKYQLPRQNLSLSSIFASIESSKARLGISDYCISQSTLEQIFVAIAKQHDTPSNVAASGVN
jgi:ATP-binding cassette subfamily A (ABC1) protein 3